MKHVILYVGHLCKVFWTKKIWPGWQGGSKKVKIWPRMGLAFIYFWPWSLLEAPKWVKDPGNGLKSIRGSWGDRSGSISRVLDPFRASRGPRSQKRGPFWAIFWPSLTPPANPVNFFSPKWLVQKNYHRQFFLLMPVLVPCDAPTNLYMPDSCPWWVFEGVIKLPAPTEGFFSLWYFKCFLKLLAWIDAYCIVTLDAFEGYFPIRSSRVFPQITLWKMVTMSSTYKQEAPPPPKKKKRLGSR